LPGDDGAHANRIPKRAKDSRVADAPWSVLSDQPYGRPNLISEFIAECADERLKFRALTRDLAKAVVVTRHERCTGRLDWCIERYIGEDTNGLPTGR
jgi:hypothetical protein